MEIDFVHARENNYLSQDYLNANKDHLNNQCLKVYELLKSGVRLTVISAMNDYQVMSLPRRILDIETKLGIVIPRTRKGKIIEYYL